MSIGKTNPLRQQMINMMYLVLTALLALNVSAEILNAFKSVNDGMNNSIGLMDQQNSATMLQFDGLMESVSNTTKPFKLLADETNDLANSFYNDVQKLIDLVEKESGGVEIINGENQLRDMKNMEVAERLFAEQNSPYGDELQKQINDVRAKFTNIALKLENLSETFSLSDFEKTIALKAEDKGNKSWAYNNFHMVPSIAAITVLKKIQQDIRTTQSNLLYACISEIAKGENSFNQLKAIVSSNKSSLPLGDQFEAKIILAAYDTNQAADVTINGEKVKVQNGYALYNGSTTKEGVFAIPGAIDVKNKKTGKLTSYPFNIEYSVYKTQSVVSPTAMNVIYSKLENPIDISVPGYKSSDVTATISKGKLNKLSDGKYEVVVPEISGSNRNVNIIVKTKLENGEYKTVGTHEFRVFNVPKPEGFFGAKRSGDNITKSEIRLSNSVSARLENFIFQGIKYNVVSYKLIYLPKKDDLIIQNVKGSLIPSDLKSKLERANTGDLIIVENLKATSPKLGSVTLQPIVLTVQ